MTPIVIVLPSFICPLRSRDAWRLKFHVQAAVAVLAVAHVDPAAVLLVDALVDGQVELLDERQQPAVVVLGTHGDVGGLTALVLAVGRATHNPVQLGTAVAAVDPDGTAPRLAQWVEHRCHQFVQGGDGAVGRRVVDTQLSGGCRSGQFLDSEVFHRVVMRMCALG